MTRIRFETGQVVNFDGNPTPADVEEVATRLGIGQQPTQTKLGDRGLKGVATGVAKSGLGLVRGTGQLLQGAGQRAIAGVATLPSLLPGGAKPSETFKTRLGEVKASTGADIFDPTTQLGGKVKEGLEAVGTAEKIGFGIGEIAQFIAPSTKLAKFEKGKKLLTRVGTEAGTFGTISAMQEGEINDEVKTEALVGGLFPVFGAGLSVARKRIFKGRLRKGVGEKIQTSVIRPRQKDIKDGFKIANVTKHNVGGTLEETITKTHVKLNDLSKQLQNKLKGANIVVDLNKVKVDAEKILTKGRPLAFGDIGATKRVLKQLEGEITEQAGKKGVVDLVKANQIKRGAGTKGAWAYNRPETDASAVENVYTAFYNSLKKEIEKKAPAGVKDINKQMSELIPISNAGLRRLTVEQRNNVLSLTDSIGLFASMFDPRALALLGASMLSKSGRFANYLAQSAKRARERGTVPVKRTALGERAFGGSLDDGSIKAGMSIEDVTKGKDFKLGGKPTQLNNLTEQAKKYKTADEFVEADKIQPILENKYPNLDFFVSETERGITLSKIIVPKSERGAGIGTSFMKDLVAYADKTGQKIVTTPTKDFGGVLSKLKNFYKKFGFVENKGRAKDFSTRETFIRLSETKSQLKDIWKKAHKK